MENATVGKSLNIFMILLAVFTLLARTETFLQDTNSTSVALSLTEFDQLLRIIMKEEKALHQLEHYVGRLENNYKEQDININNLTGENTFLKSKDKALEVSVASFTVAKQEMEREIKNLTEIIHTLQNDFKLLKTNMSRMVLDNKRHA